MKKRNKLTWERFKRIIPEDAEEIEKPHIVKTNQELEDEKR